MVRVAMETALSALSKGTRRRLLLTSQKANPPQNLTLRLPNSRTMNKYTSAVKPPSLWYFVMAAKAD